MGTPRVGPLGILSATGAMLYRDANGDVDEVPIGAEGQILTVIDSGGGVLVPSWEDLSDLAIASLMTDATDAIFKKINVDGGGDVDNPKARVNGTHSVLGFEAATREGIAWQRFMPSTYGGGDLQVDAYGVPTSTPAPAEDVEWKVAFERDVAGVSIAAAAFAALQTIAAAATVAANQIVKSSAVIAAGAATAAIAAGDPFRFYIERNAGQGNDTYTAEAQLVRVVLTEV